MSLKLKNFHPQLNFSTRWNSVSYVHPHIWNSTRWIQFDRLKNSSSSGWKFSPKFQFQNFIWLKKIQPDEIHLVDLTKISAFIIVLCPVIVARVLLLQQIVSNGKTHRLILKREAPNCKYPGPIKSRKTLAGFFKSSDYKNF